MKANDVLFYATGIIGATTVIGMLHNKIDKEESVREFKVLKKVGLYALTFAVGCLLTDIHDAGELARSVKYGAIEI